MKHLTELQKLNAIKDVLGNLSEKYKVSFNEKINALSINGGDFDYSFFVDDVHEILNEPKYITVRSKHYAITFFKDTYLLVPTIY